MLSTLQATISATPAAQTATPSVGLKISFPKISLPFSLVAAVATMYLLVLWLCLVRWVWEDSGERSKDLRERKIFVLLVILFNFPGLLLYLILRPPLTFEEAERAKKEARLLDLELQQFERKARRKGKR